jgi:predicted amidophosphoribosyltransferase
MTRHECDHICPDCWEGWSHIVSWDCKLDAESPCEDCQGKREQQERDAIAWYEERRFQR